MNNPPEVKLFPFNRLLVLKQYPNSYRVLNTLHQTQADTQKTNPSEYHLNPKVYILFSIFKIKNSQYYLHNSYLQEMMNFKKAPNISALKMKNMIPNYFCTTAYELRRTEKKQSGHTKQITTLSKL